MVLNHLRFKKTGFESMKSSQSPKMGVYNVV
jgi:hypothetical protein